MYSRDAWNEYHEARIIKGFESRDDDKDFKILVAIAKSRGFEPAPLSALLATGNNDELFTWQGRVWIKCKVEHGQMALAL